MRSGPAPSPPSNAITVIQWLCTRDADLSALRRSCRAAIVTPALFAVGDQLISSSTLAIFAAVGSLAMLLFVDFSGPISERLLAQASLVGAGAILVCLGTLASQTVWAAVIGMVVVGFVVLFVGVVSSVLASATTALLVAFILPLTLPGPVSSVPDRLIGWLLAGAISLVAIAVLWPAPTRDPLRRSTSQACALLARRLRAEAECVRHGLQRDRLPAVDALVTESTAAVAALRDSFFGTPYRPTGLTTATRTLVRLVDQVVWLDAVLERMPFKQQSGPTGLVVCEVKLAAAALLDRGAVLLEAVRAGPADLTADLERLRHARKLMQQTVRTALPVHRGSTSREEGGKTTTTTTTEFVSSLEPSFRAHEMSVAISAIATNIELTVAARRRSWWQRLVGRRPEGVGSSLSSAQERAGAHVARHSVWLHNSVRGAIALGSAVLVAELTGVQHSFWVVFGALAVLRSNALNTGQNALRALLGNVVGIVIGGALIYTIGPNTTVFWLLLPFAVFFTGLAPAAISFAAGQAGFTAATLILFNTIEPAGWTIGLVRIEDVAIGCGVSLAVGALLWPRGASSALGRALAEALSESARYLRGAVEYGVSRCDTLVPVASAPHDQSRRAAAAARRLDDAFREFLAERGTKHVALADVSALITGVAVIRLNADAVLDLWRDDGSPTGDRTAARAEILASGGLLVDWYEQAASALAGSGAVPNPLRHDKVADGRLIEAVRRDLTGEDRQGTATAVKMIWTADYLDATRRLQARLFAPATATAAARRSSGTRLRNAIMARIG